MYYNIHEASGISVFRESIVFRIRSTNLHERGNAAFYANLGKRSHRIFGKYNSLDLDVTTLTRLLVNREGFLNKLRDYRDCRYERDDRRSCRPKADICAHVSL